MGHIWPPRGRALQTEGRDTPGVPRPSSIRKTTGGRALAAAAARGGRPLRLGQSVDQTLQKLLEVLETLLELLDSVLDGGRIHIRAISMVRFSSAIQSRNAEELPHPQFALVQEVVRLGKGPPLAAVSVEAHGKRRERVPLFDDHRQ